MRYSLNPNRTILGNLVSRFTHRQTNTPSQAPDKMAKVSEKVSSVIDQSDYLSRDLSWLKFNERVLDQARNPEDSPQASSQRHRTLMEQLKFLAISASNLDEFFMIRVGSLYNYLDYHKQRVDYSGLREVPFRKALFTTAQQFCREQQAVFTEQLLPLFAENGLQLAHFDELTEDEQEEATNYFDRAIYPTLTPMLYDYTHTFPVLLARVLIFGVVTQNPDGADLQSLRSEDEEDRQRLSFVQIPANLPRFVSFEREDTVVFLPIEEVVRRNIKKLYRNVEISSVNLFRITRNGDFTLDENDDDEVDFIDEVRQKIKNRRLGRVTRVEVETEEGGQVGSPWMLNLLKKRWEIDDLNIFESRTLLDFSAFWQIIGNPEFKDDMPRPHAPVPPLGMNRDKNDDIFEIIKQRDLLLHHPYNNFEPVLQLLEQAAEDPNVLAIKITVYRLAKRSRITEALLKAAENGKHVSVLFEVKARFDEENNIREAQRLQKAGCFVIYGISRYKTHTKLLLVVRNEGSRVVRYAHMATGNYNEDTSKLYTDIGLLTTNETYTHDISEFFNVITGHSLPNEYQYLITAPRDMREQLLRLIRLEAEHAQRGLPSGICIKVNSLEDKLVIDELYKASQAGVPIRLIVRSICCLRPKRAGLSDNISVRSIVGDFLEHTRIYYFHNNGDPKVYGGSADVMVRSFDRRIESLFFLADARVKQQAILILKHNLLDNVNAYELKEDGDFVKCEVPTGSEPFNMHQRFFDVTEKDVVEARLFDPEIKPAEVAQIEEEYQEGAERAIANI